MVLVILNLFNQIRDIRKSLLLTLGALLKLIDLLDDKGLDLLLHDWRLFLDYLLCLSCLVLDNARILTSQLSDQFLDLALLLPVERLESNEPLNTLNQGDLHITLLLLASISIVTVMILIVLLLLKQALLLQLPGIESVSSVINHDLHLALSLELGHSVDSLAKVLPSEHDVLNVLQRDGQQGDRVYGPGTVGNLVHSQTTDLVHDTASLADGFNSDVLVL